jgi:quinolinate synthase
MNETDACAEIIRLKKEYGDRLCILAHYYQPDEVYRLADAAGDSYRLALEASRSPAEHIVFCGVAFMAESARMLIRPEQRVYLPAPDAGCPLADMATAEELETALAALQAVSRRPVAPVVYINSSAAVKAAAGKAGGIVCTSSNAALIVEALTGEGKAVLFLPDMNLGLNTARRLKLTEAQTVVYGRRNPPPRVPDEAVMFVWDGFCNVHARFQAQDVRKAKNLYPYAKILVHPECPGEVVALADYTGSTAGIIKECGKAAAGEVLFIGTELNLVNRLAAGRSDVKIFPLRKSGCVNMNKTTPEKLLETIRLIASPPSPREVSVPPAESALAARALRAMIELVEKRKASA